jgi:hypothetical protein
MKKIEIDVPDGISGAWEVKTFTITQRDADLANLRAAFHGGRGRISPGEYKKLSRNKELIMSNTPDECRDFAHFVHVASGSVLVNGLGLGVLLKALLNKPEVTEVTVIENSPDVIKLVAGTYRKDSRVTIIEADAFTWEPPKGKRYYAVWNDIWDDITSDNLPEMAKLHRKYGKRCDYQESWCKRQCQEAKRRNY